MTELGTIVADNGKFVKVRVARNSACGSCGRCGMTENQKHADFFVENTLNANVGDVVELQIPDANTAGMAFVGYILPLIPALAMLFVALALKWKEWFAVLMFFAGLAVGYVVVSIVDKVRKHKWAEIPSMNKVISSNNGVSEQIEQ